MRRVARGEAYDEPVMPEFSSEVLDFRAASESFASVRKLKRPDLKTLRLVDRYQMRKVLTIGGMLLFGKERERCFPDAWIQAGRFCGTDKTHADAAHPFVSAGWRIALCLCESSASCASSRAIASRRDCSFINAMVRPVPTSPRIPFSGSMPALEEEGMSPAKDRPPLATVGQ